MRKTLLKSLSYPKLKNFKGRVSVGDFVLISIAAPYSFKNVLSICIDIEKECSPHYVKNGLNYRVFILNAPVASLLQHKSIFVKASEIVKA